MKTISAMPRAPGQDAQHYRPPAASDVALPHERDEAAERSAANDEAARNQGPRQVIEQAASDVGHGLRDTDLHGIPSNVPGPAAPDETTGAEVPPEGGSRKSYSERQIRRRSHKS